MPRAPPSKEVAVELINPAENAWIGKSFLECGDPGAPLSPGRTFRATRIRELKKAVPEGTALQR
ncbi:MAG: hypothetical protein ACKO38_10240, partial [Planctomycetota bacterium]